MRIRKRVGSEINFKDFSIDAMAGGLYQRITI